MTTKKTKTKPPLGFTIKDCDDCTVTVDGHVYRPHAGESIELRRSGQVADLLIAAKFGLLQDLGDKSAEKLTEIEDAIQGMVDHLAAKIIAWDWTDDAGEPHGDPTSPDVIRRLTLEEQLWIYRQSTGMGERKSRGTRRNGS